MAVGGSTRGRLERVDSKFFPKNSYRARRYASNVPGIIMTSIVNVAHLMVRVKIERVMSVTGSSLFCFQDLLMNP